MGGIKFGGMTKGIFRMVTGRKQEQYILMTKYTESFYFIDKIYA